MKTFKTFSIGCVVIFTAIFSCKDLNKNVLADVADTPSVSVKDNRVTVLPVEYIDAVRNPMKGLREFIGPGIDPKRTEYPYPYGTLTKEYMQWNMLENSASDGVQKIIDYSNHRWKGFEDINMKVVPRVFIIWMEPWHGGVAKNTWTTNPDDLNGWHWPSDIPGEVAPYRFEGGRTVIDAKDAITPITGGYFDPNFKNRVKVLVEKLGQAWDNDPRVAYIEMGIIGEWGEHHDPDITTYWAPHDEPIHVDNRTWIPGIEKVLGDAFTAAFKNKKVMVRYAYEFKDYSYGIYWDSFAMPEEQKRGYEEMMKLGDRWKTQPMGGEITWNWGGLGKFKSFEQVVGDNSTQKTVVEQIRNLHINHLGGITWANFKDPSFIPNAEIIQKAMGYRFVMSQFSYPTNIKYNESFNVSFKVKNTGSTPFYYNWPVEIALLKEDTKEKVWSKILNGVNISEWMPGDKWNIETSRYQTLAETYSISSDIKLDVQLPNGKYIISVAVLDPAGMLPSLRFAINNYFQGGRHPMGYVGVNTTIDKYEVSADEFMNLSADKTLKYKLE